jgi:hypothetical protein
VKVGASQHRRWGWIADGKPVEGEVEQIGHSQDSAP